MEKVLGKSKVIISVVSIVSILITSMLSMFVGDTLTVSADDNSVADTETTVTYPLNGSYDTDFVVTEDDGVYYSDPKGTIVSNFTGYATDFITYAEGSGTQQDPYIIETANEFAAVVTGNIYDEYGNPFNTEYVAFKVDESIKAFNLSNTNSNVDFSGDMTASEVREALENAAVTIEWKLTNPFSGMLDGSGVEVYGLKTVDRKAALIPDTTNNVTVMNITVKNSYFSGAFCTSALIGHNYSPSGLQKNAVVEVRNVNIHDNAIISSQDYGGGSGLNSSGVVIGGISTPSGSCLLLDDSLIYGNIAEHKTRHIKYGMFGNLMRDKSAIVQNCIIMDTVPYSASTGWNTFYGYTYKNVYTNTCDGTAWYNYNGDISVDEKGDYILDATNGGYAITSGTKIKYTYTANGALSAELSYYKPGASTSTDKYTKTFDGPVYQVMSSEIQGTAIIEGIDAEKWTYSENGYPTPKVYMVKSGKGVVSNSFFEGDGSKTTPYVITTAEELAYMLVSDNLGKYYKLAKDITINDTSVGDWTKNARTWFTSNDIPEFKGIFDGNGKTVSGIYYDGTQKGEYAGLIPMIGSSGSVSRVTIADSELNGDTGALGGAIGSVAERSKLIIDIKAVTVKDTVKYGGNAVNGGIVGRIGNSVVKISNCISETSGIFGTNDGIAKIYSCISVNAIPFEQTTNIYADSVYTNVKCDVENVTYVPVENMIGKAAESNMPGLKIPTAWVVVNNDFPAPTGAEASFEGVKGQLWSGAKATGFAGGDGTSENPYLIETAEQLAYCIWKTNIGTRENRIHYKLTADIYLNDVNSDLWKEKLGCNQWLTLADLQNETNFRYTVLDGDGYAIYGLYYETPTTAKTNVRVALVPRVGVGSVIKNIAISNAYFNMGHPDDFAGTLAAALEAWNNKKWPMDPSNAPGNAALRQDEEFQDLQPKFINCLADSTCYVGAQKNYGGFIGATSGCLYMENCIYTGSVANNPVKYYSGGLVGLDWSDGITIVDSVSLPQCCNKVVGGNVTSQWIQGNPNKMCITWDDVYYFSHTLQGCATEECVKLSSPSDRIGDAAKEKMVGLDWVDKFDQEYYDTVDSTTWLKIDGGTPIPSIFAKHRTEEEFRKLSDTNFKPPYVTVSFVTNADDVVVDDMVGRMYEPLNLPEVSRFGYELKGWHVFDDLSYIYDKGYFPTRDLQLFAEWEATGITQNFEKYTDTLWDYDSSQWNFNRPGAIGGYSAKYVRNGGKSMHLLDTNTEPADMLLNYEQMLEPGAAYTIKIWVTTDKENNPDTLLTLVHNSEPDYFDTQVAAEDMMVVKGLEVGEWVQYSYSFVAKTKWVSIRAGAGSSLYFDDIVIGKTAEAVGGIGNDGGSNVVSPETSDIVTVTVLISAIMTCAIVLVVSKKNLVEVID